MFVIYTNIVQIREEEKKDINDKYLPYFPQKLKVLQSLLNTWDKQKKSDFCLTENLGISAIADTLNCNEK